jgi:hypothetical protein
MSNEECNAFTSFTKGFRSVDNSHLFALFISYDLFDHDSQLTTKASSIALCRPSCFSNNCEKNMDVCSLSASSATFSVTAIIPMIVLLLAHSATLN